MQDSGGGKTSDIALNATTIKPGTRDSIRDATAEVQHPATTWMTASVPVCRGTRSMSKPAGNRPKLMSISSHAGDDKTNLAHTDQKKQISSMPERTKRVLVC
ncbi:hypothetical protein J3459_014028 [Metarhizium acridum]|nr:hypothetical protein J3459_014028 [Metarhizium acridum]